MKTLILGLAAMVFSSSTFAQTSGPGVRETTPAGGTPLRIQGPGNAGGQSTNGAARSGRASQVIGIGMNVAVGGMFASQCGRPNYFACAMAALSFAQAGLMAGAAAKSGDVEIKTDQIPDFGATPFSNVDPNDPSTWPPGTKPTPEQVSAFNRVKQSGWTGNKDGTVTGPDGKTWSSKDFSSAEAMAAAGVPSDQISGLLSTMDAANQMATAKVNEALNDPNVVAMGFDSGAGGGGRSPASYDGADSSFDDYLAKLRNPFGLSAKQRAQMVAGKMVSHGDDQIGVKVDDIFKMVHRRYQEKRAGDEFIEAPPAPTPAAAPGATGRKVTTPRGR